MAMSAARMSHGSLASDCTKACAVPWKAALTLAGSPICACAFRTASRACESEISGARLKERVTAGNWPWWFTDSEVARSLQRATSLSVNHQGQFPAVTLSFNLAPEISLSQALDAVRK